jgi:flavin-dependent dehydrogenase
VSVDAIVVGAGPAGSAAATVLAQAHARVLLVEKDRFPRPKVCGEFLSAGALPCFERLGVRERIHDLGPERIEAGEVFPRRGRGIPFRLEAPAFGISRYRLDALLAERARAVGAQWRSPARVLSIEGGPDAGFRVRVSGPGPEETLSARAVIGAWGRWDALDRDLGRGFLARPRFFGWSRDYAGGSDDLSRTVRLYLFAGGYCGLSRIEGGAVHLAGVISERARRRLPAGWDSVLAHARRENPNLDRGLARLCPEPAGFLGTVPVVFTAKPATERGILLAGDAAGVIDPFSGEGQTTALSSGILAGETAAKFLRGELSPNGYVAAYEAQWRTRFRRRFAWSALLRRLVLHPRLGDVAASLAGERLVRFGIGALHG